MKNRRAFLVSGLSFAAISAIPMQKLLAQTKPSPTPSSAAPDKNQPKLTTHVLDITSGKPAAGMRIDFSVKEGDRYRLIKTLYTNKDGRTDEPLLIGNTMAVGRYRQLFYVADYYTKLGVDLPNPPFLDEVPLDFAIFDAAQKYHVPLLCTPWSYTTYRGS